MKYKSLVYAISLLMIMATRIFSADISGEWVVEAVDEKGVVAKTYYEFIVEGNKLTGSVLGYRENEWPIIDGRINGDKISFMIKQSVGDRIVTYIYTGKASGDTIKLEVTPVRDSGFPQHTRCTARRVRP
jgi:hypothetical protein